MTLERFSAKEIAALISLSTVCLVVLIATIAFIFRPPPPEGRQAVYQLASGLIGMAAGLLGGVAGTAYAIERKEKTDGNHAE